MGEDLDFGVELNVLFDFDDDVFETRWGDFAIGDKSKFISADFADDKTDRIHKRIIPRLLGSITNRDDTDGMEIFCAPL